ncbi:MAG TPA: YggS family pyridoxal phosphate-dependent enzyme [Pyrinomonadaceae bacterium]|nr:YggS family pyridoxal phosphate-dependent enzyme [Pyrinomonadaceae bacterium]HRK49642.1 YggS family pyridoxal phosphate-dependent enzyme [Pyrinomonadaceae bacterium]
MATNIAANLTLIMERIASAAARSGRSAEDVRLVAVSKTHSPDLIRDAIAAGVRSFGENKVQEAEGKIAEVGRDAAEWHLIGHLQSNKVRKAIQLFDVIQSVDSTELAARLERICNEEGRSQLSVFIQVDLAGEATKSGVAEDDLPKLVSYLRECERLKLDGLMIIPPFFDDPESSRPYFQSLRVLRDRMAAEGAFTGGRGELSMGMSHDFEVAIEEGATIVRIGTAVFGERRTAR